MSTCTRQKAIFVRSHVELNIGHSLGVIFRSSITHCHGGWQLKHLLFNLAHVMQILWHQFVFYEWHSVCIKLAGYHGILSFVVRSIQVCTYQTPMSHYIIDVGFSKQPSKNKIQNRLLERTSYKLLFKNFIAYKRNTNLPKCTPKASCCSCTFL